MAKILDCGSISAHDRELGINHKNIAKELTTANWNNKAIVRDGIYMYVLKCKYRENSTSNEKIVYYIDGLKGKNKFDTLNEALSKANNQSNIEGKYPQERNNAIQISPIMVFPHIKKKYQKQ